MSQKRKARRKKHVGSTHVAAPALKAEMIVPDEMAPRAADLLSALFAPMGIEVVATPLPDPPQKKK